LRKEIYANNIFQELDKDNYFNTSTTINQSERNVEISNFKDKFILFISTNIITQHINNTNMLRLLKLEAKLAIAKL